MKQRSIKVLLIGLVASIALAACGGGATPAPEATPIPSPTPVPATAVPEQSPTEEPTAEPEPETDEVGLLSEQITAKLEEWKPVITADALYENLTDGEESNDPFIVSVRSAEHYELGHVPGAINIPWRQIADSGSLAMLPTDEQIVVYCYTGHTGQAAATILNILGYDVTNLKFGMMGWTDSAEVLATTAFAAAAGYPVETEANVATETYELAALETGETEAFAIAQERAQAFLAEWKPVISAEALFENLNDGDVSNDPFLLSVRSAEHYEIGHIAGAYNIPWREVATAENLAYLPTDTQIVDYCYTGHTGQVAATALALLGYDVTNLKFGMMGWTDDAEVLAQTPFAAAAGYPVESAAGVVSGNEFTTLADHISEQLAEWKPVTTAEALFENLNDGDETNDPFVLSVRSREHYELGHVPGAYNVPWRGIADPDNLSLLPADRQIVVYCYTGHTGQVAASILNFLGYDAINLKFGMMGWTDDVAVLAQTPFAAAPGYPVEIETNELTDTYDPPTLATGEATAVAIAQARAQAFLEEWKPVISADALFENLNDGDAANDAFLLSVRSGEHYAVGHIAGAYNIPWREVANAENLAYLPTDVQIVDYCYTGHTGQVAATALALLGYDVANLKFGMMGWTDDADVLATSPFAAAAGYPTETEANEFAGAAGESTELAELITAKLSEWKPVISAEALFENLSDGDESNDPFVVSVRSAEHYDIGHIPGAYNIPWREIANADSLSMLPADEPIVVYCYTGHTGQVAASILNFLGYDVTNLKFGMMGWTDDAEVLAQTPFAAAPGYPVEVEANGLVETYTAPVIDTDEGNASAMVQALAQAFLAEWKPVTSAEALYENLNDGDEANDPFILSVRSAEHYEIGHIADAFNIPWREVATAENLAYLPTDQQIVDYCYTGHTGQVAATALALLGYDVQNLKFGMMGWTDDAEVLATQPFEAAAGYPTEQ